MSARADWHTTEVNVDLDEDPFAMPVEEVGDRIDLRDPIDRLNVRLRELIRREAALDESAVTCPIKDHADTCCLACPLSEAHDRESVLGGLCRVGREQERVLTQLVVARHAGE